MSTKIKIGIVGGAGYTGGELLRILVNHPNAEIVFVHSNSNAGNPIYKVHTDLIGSTDLVFTGELSNAIDVLFLCVGHGDAIKFLQANPVESHIKIIDLSQDFRIEKDGNDFIYGLPELQRDKIKLAKNIANPGCFATAIQLGLLPLAAENVLTNDVHVSGITGSTGAGQSLSQTSHFSWRNNNMSVYKALNHQHLKEIRQSLTNLQSSLEKNIHFIPYRGDFTRGIIATMYTPCSWTIDEAIAKYKAYYASHPFTHVVDENIDLKQVVNTNNCLLYLEKHGDQLMIVSIIDNLLKGASGHAVQNMNLMFGLEETVGLRLKAASF
ncbi:N-acetyl-gamma-glutamyl-phosphate reductase [Cytophaga hutchinsonii]|uniref:N-acetyl-gamma-glutamyl-phosphate reductase n=1 Tax=Cytophaga hutchinsonii (strain ATCC 33406 / DSM 1761 / CIP 103989 / NBRC 15051 / NCIMB 9469 / D465) TaxID=269798 RepID=A0A6N4SV85_CYTH3|nr:N-acetyl-gamma-glutamyl-phosphate reductase [Cytophaga hutchinsonii]ABG60321.1 N-acetyl-gamma-glutamyl-phosphate reductase [Cytophaga hutchinsonii ATCC 33406]SFX98981.1 N-acetyl-gamma-glutamyl-phosphate reductase [Cytophaga hutchinsonii ATCC 33406]